jgi:hypothetical protein
MRNQINRYTIPVLFLLVVGIVGMLNRGGPESMPVEEAGLSPGTRVAASPTITDSWDASSAVVVGELALEATVVGVGIVAAPTAVASSPSDQAWPLSREDAESVLLTAGWPVDWVAEGLSVACGYGNLRHPQGESGCDPRAVGASGEVGMFQIMRGWADWCGIDHQYLYLPLVNARCALMIREYEEARGLPSWGMWSVKP